MNCKKGDMRCRTCQFSKLYKMCNGKGFLLTCTNEKSKSCGDQVDVDGVCRHWERKLNKLAD